MVRSLSLMVFLWVFLATPVSARTWTVFPDGTGDAPTIQAAIAASTHHDTVLVMPGAYLENLRFLGKKIVVGSLFLLTADSTAIEQTVIDGSAGYSSVVQMIDAEEPGSVLCGLTLTGGAGTLWGWPFGGGVFVYESSPTLRDLILRDNMYAGSDEYGGGIAILFGSPLVERCLFEENEAYTGGALDIEGPTSRPVIRDCVIRNNRARASSVADVWYGADPRFERVTIVQNAPIGSAHLFQVSAESRLELVSCTLTGNTARMLATWDRSEVVVANCILWGNPGPAFRIYVGCSLTVTASDVEGGPGAVEQDSGAQVNWLAGNLDQDPLFVGAPAGDYRLQPSSPCVNAGVAHWEWDGRTIVDLVPADYCGSAPEIGAFELCAEAEGAPDSPEIPRRNLGLSVCPNPTRGGAEIVFDAEGQGPVRVDVFDAGGRRLNVLQDGDLSSGEHRLRWDGCDALGRSLPSGAYWVRVQTGVARGTTKVLLAR